MVAVSDPDASALEQLGVTTPLVTIPNGVDTRAYEQLAAARKSTGHPSANIVFTGKMDYRPNIDAALWFGEQVLPMIQSSLPDAVFQIVGQQPHARLEPLRNNRGIQITGAVPEIQPYLAEAAVFVIPMRVGGGTRLKALEAMAAGLPIVTTSLGIEGIDVSDGRELLVRDEPAAFADAVATLVRDQRSGGEQSARLGAAARSFVEAHYDWATIIPQLEAAYAGMLRAKEATA